MREGRYKAWCFHHPDLDTENPGLSLSAKGSVEMVDEMESVKQSILILLSTIPGERVMRPDYGCDLHRLTFSPNDHTTAGLAIHYVKKALNRWEKRIDILRLDAAPARLGPGRLDIFLEYRLRSNQITDELNFSVLIAED